MTSADEFPQQHILFILQNDDLYFTYQARRVIEGYM